MSRAWWEVARAWLPGAHRTTKPDASRSEPRSRDGHTPGGLARTGAARFWTLVLSTYAAVATTLVITGAPSAFLFAGVASGSCVALLTCDVRDLPVPFQRFGMATVGIAAGAQINVGVLNVVAQRPVTILGSVCATILITLLCGQVLRLSRDVSPLTALFASIAGGASGVTAVVREVGGDDAVVVAIQYLRVVAVLTTIPIASRFLGASSQPLSSEPASPAVWSGTTFTVVCLLVGLALARWLAFSASRLIVPLLVATAVSLSGALGAAVVPPPILAGGFAAIGLMVGLAMTRSTIAVLLRLLPFAVLQLVLVLASTLVTGLVLARLSGISDLDGYLASTPGGLPAVTAITIESDATVGIVITVQLVRLFVALALAAVLGAWFVRQRARPATPAETGSA